MITYNIPRGRGSYFDMLLVRRARMAQVPIKTVFDFSETFRLGLTAFNVHVINVRANTSFVYALKEILGNKRISKSCVLRLS